MLAAPRPRYFLRSASKMEEVEGRLAELVRSYRHLYDSSLKDYKDYEVAQRSWREIAAALGKDPSGCRKIWKNVRDRFVKAKKRAHGRRGGAGGRHVSPILSELGWLHQFIKHRKTGTKLGVGGEDTGPCSPNGAAAQLGTTCSPTASGLSFASPQNAAFPAAETPASTSSPGSSLHSFAPSPHPAASPLPHSPQPPTPSPTVASHPSGPPCLGSPSCKRRRDTEEVLLQRLEGLDQERKAAMQQDSEDYRFAVVISDLLAKIDPQHKSDVKFRVHKLLFEAEKKYPKQV